MGKPRVFVTDEQLADAIKACAGVVADIAKALDVSPRTVQLRIHKSRELLALLRQVNADVLALAEAALLKILRDPNAPDHARVVMFVLRTKGRKLGYSERVELGGAPDAAPIRVQFFVPSKEDDE